MPIQQSWNDLAALTAYLPTCQNCPLSQQGEPHGPVLYRGNPAARRMLVGEALGRDEVAQGQPFVGPAGQLLQRIWESMGWDLDQDWLTTNAVLCRPIAPPRSGKQNLTPSDEQVKACRPHLESVIKIVDPTLIVPLGKTAVNSLLPHLRREAMEDIVGRIYFSDEWPGVTLFPMYHPSFLLRVRETNNYPVVREKLRKHLFTLKGIVED